MKLMVTLLLLTAGSWPCFAQKEAKGPATQELLGDGANAAGMQTATPAAVPLTPAELYAEAEADPAGFIDNRSPEEVIQSGFFNLENGAASIFPDRFQLPDNMMELMRETATLVLDVDLAAQKLTVTKGERAGEKFTISSGKAGFGTPSGHCYRPDFLDKNHKSGKYNGAPMPNSVFFNQGIAIHGTVEANYPNLGRPASHGCIRLKKPNAEIIFNLVKSAGKDNTIVCVKGKWRG